MQGTHEGLDAARARGQRLGRPPAMTAEQIRQARAILTRPEETVSSVARLLGVSRSTIYKYVPELGKQLAAGEDRPMPDVAECDQLLGSRREATA
ncbi:helix-turn-helix domain-containing protein [Nocardia beijingensis]|uniref:helix-turn-helix domain-containing protein n=1 Tax=Nocardia beijingensis TaxID=95162 RepID=UPI002B4AF953|nr:helix-turn-helix domain-containing protein [Nocardia beijingensis]